MPRFADYKNILVAIKKCPDNIPLKKVNVADFTGDWNTFPSPSSTQTIGDQVIADNKYYVLHIPSVVTQGDYNLLINPNHPGFKKIKIIGTEKFPFDKRIFK